MTTGTNGQTGSWLVTAHLFKNSTNGVLLICTNFKATKHSREGNQEQKQKLLDFYYGKNNKYISGELRDWVIKWENAESISPSVDLFCLTLPYAVYCDQC